MTETIKKVLPENAVFALDIGTRSIIGMLGMEEEGRIRILGVERAEHSRRAMIDGQIEDIAEVARLAAGVKTSLEEKCGYRLQKVYLAAAGRALRTESASFELEFPELIRLDEEQISRLETGAVNEAQKNFIEREGESRRQFFLVGYTISQYYLDDYPISSLLDHKGRKLRADIVATFLPGEVVESLYAAMNRAGLEVAGLTLEPIAAMNAAIPEKLRLLNLVMVDIGAGTSDIAVCRDGKVVGYTMATLAGDEITETLMKAYLVDFETAEGIKAQLGEKQEISFTDILGFDQRLPSSQIMEALSDAIMHLGKEIADKVKEVNGGTPSAVFLAGGGSRMNGLTPCITQELELDAARASVAGRFYSIHAFSDVCDLDKPEYATPLGIAVSAGLNLINDSFAVTLNGKRAKLFSNGTLRLSELLMMNGYVYSDFLGRSGRSLVVTVDGIRRLIRGGTGEPALLQVNGINAVMTDIVHAGDSIVFVPATQGSDASLTAGQLEEETGWPVLINGIIVSPDMLLQSGDDIRTVPDNTDADGTLSDCSAAEELSDPVGEEDCSADMQEDADENDTAEIAGTEEPESEPVPAAVRQLHLELNGSPLLLPAKEDGQPYYLMDLLDYSGLDLDHIQKPVVLRVNGEYASFRQEIKEYDIIIIE